MTKAPGLGVDPDRVVTLGGEADLQRFPGQGVRLLQPARQEDPAYPGKGGPPEGALQLRGAALDIFSPVLSRIIPLSPVIPERFLSRGPSC